ncbi:unnamed protein product [Calypogeia fissa]
MTKIQFQPFKEKIMAAETDPNDKPNCLVADMFLDWSEELAEELQIPRYLIFTTAGSFPYAVLQGQVEGEQQIDFAASSTGAFMSRCGWNSSMESISSGVPVLTWHLGGDQPVNARFRVDGLKLELPMQKFGNIEPVVKGEDIAATIKTLMVDEKGKEVQKTSIRFKELAMGSM